MEYLQRRNRQQPGSLTVGGVTTSAATITINGGVLNCAGTSQFGNGAALNHGGTLIFNSNATFSSGATFNYNGGTFGMGTLQTLAFSGGAGSFSRMWNFQRSTR